MQIPDTSRRSAIIGGAIALGFLVVALVLKLTGYLLPVLEWPDLDGLWLPRVPTTGKVER